MIVESQSGHGNAVSLPPLIVGTRHCRVLYIIPMQPETISGAQWNNQFGVSIPSRGSGKGDLTLGKIGRRLLRVSIPSRGSGKGDVKKTKEATWIFYVSIPSRGSGKGDSSGAVTRQRVQMFQSPLGEVVKETLVFNSDGSVVSSFNPLSGKW